MVNYHYPLNPVENNVPYISIEFLEPFLLFLITYMDKSRQGNIKDQQIAEENILNSLHLILQIYTVFSSTKLIYEDFSQTPFFSKNELICLKKYKKYLGKYSFYKQKDKKIAQKFITSILQLDIHNKLFTETNLPSHTWIAKDISIYSSNI
ncbi:hypothetical protein [Bacillus cereus]|uniref:hypothetical protein n=1 Tax=Bacillus cereus TaxID=1396 RepID=UPI0018F63DDF|nr:hypothetical protein [Bacillus cereus]MBJ8025905.1 hypothetical protein [Bacillus cereus]MBJ8038290.1 hypothetical protein [Bacillus cereus]